MNEEVVRAFFDAYNEHDADKVAALMTEDGSVTSAYWGMDRRTYVGREGLADYFEEMDQMWEKLEFHLERLEQGDDSRLVAVSRLEGIETGTKVSVAPEQGLVFEFRDGRIASVVVVPDVDEALAQL